jgi:hypothetical protein
VAHAHPTPILSLPEDSFTAALARIDPASRALLDLSLRRGMRPEEIGDLLATDPESVIVAREAALEQLAAHLGVERGFALDDLRVRLATLPSESWTPTADDEEERPPPERPALTVVEAPADRAQPREPTPRKERKSRLPLLLALLAVAAVVLVVVLASGGSDDQTDGSKAAATGRPSDAEPSKPAGPAAQPKPKPAATTGTRTPLAPVTATARAEGTASLLDGGKRLRLDVTGLAAGSYEVWLYDSVIEANLIGKGTGPKLALDLKLPADASSYRYIDISRERADGNPNHSGVSVLRVPLAKLSR